MINLEDLDYNDDTKELRADFGGFLEDGFYIECEIDYDEDIEKAEPESGIMKDCSTFSNFTFWYFKIYNFGILKYIILQMKKFLFQIEL